MKRKPKVGDRIKFGEYLGIVTGVELRHFVTIDITNGVSERLQMSHVDSKGIDLVTEEKIAGTESKRRVPVRKQRKSVPRQGSEEQSVETG